MAKKRKTLTVMLTVSYPTTSSDYYTQRRITPAMIRREIRTLINEQCAYTLNLEDGPRVKSIRAVRKGA